MKTPQQLYDYLKGLNIAYTIYEHAPAYTVEEASKVAAHVPGGWCKNLFLKDSKKRVWLITALFDAKIDLKKTSKALQAPELRFADAQMLMQYLGVEPGSVTPLGLINDTEHAVHVVLDKKIFDYDIIAMHPLVNNASVTLSPDDLVRFIEACGNKLLVFDFTATL